MQLLVNCLSILFIMLILYQAFLAYTINSSFVEGLENIENENKYTDYDTKSEGNVMILAQKNAANIMAIRDQLTDVIGVKKQVSDLQTKVDTMQSQLNDIGAAQQQQVDEIVPDKDIVITGTEDEEEEEEE
jgi:hypothetical protein